MPRSDPEPAARPLLVGALMPPLVPPTFEEMMLRLTTLTSPGSVVFCWFFCELIQVDVAQRRELIEHLRGLRRLDPRIHGHDRVWA